MYRPGDCFRTCGSAQRASPMGRESHSRDEKLTLTGDRREGRQRHQHERRRMTGSMQCGRSPGEAQPSRKQSVATGSNWLKAVDA
jgi:hypothetical protein